MIKNVNVIKLQLKIFVIRKLKIHALKIQMIVIILEDNVLRRNAQTSKLVNVKVL